jgi:hypothetical protein
MKSFKSLWVELVGRWKSKTPVFWKKVQKKALVIGGVVTVMLGGSEYYNEYFVVFLKHVMEACGVIALIAQFTKDDSPETKQ